MKKFFVVGIAAVAFCGAPALAADIPTKAPAYVDKGPVAGVFNWSGFYVGGNAGYGWENREVTFTPNDGNAQFVTCGGGFGGTCAPPTSLNLNGALGGLQAGYNWQPNQNWLLGIETDFDWSGIRGTGTSNFLIEPGLFPPGTASFQASQNVKWFGTVRGRLGFVPTNNLLVYGTAGFAYGRVDKNVALNVLPGVNASGFGGAPTFGFSCTAGPNCFLGSSSRTLTGWTAGAGFETMVSSKLTFKMEYLYVNLGSENVNVVAISPSDGPNASSFNAHFNNAFNVVRAGLNWRY